MSERCVVGEVIAFQILNFREVDEADALAVSALDARLAELGALPAGSEMRAGTVHYAVRVTRDDLTVDEIEAAFAAAGFETVRRER